MSTWLLRSPIRRSGPLNVLEYASRSLPSLGLLATPVRHPLGAPDPLPPPPRQKDDGFLEPERLPPLPRLPPAFARWRTPRRRLQSVRFTSTTGISRTPLPRAGGFPHDPPRRVASPLSGIGQPSFLGSGVRHGFRRLNPPRARLLAPRLSTPTLVTRTPSVASSWPAGWRGRPRRACDSHTGYELTKRACLRETRRRKACFRETSQQGRFLRSPAKRSALGLPKVPSFVEPHLQGWWRARRAVRGLMDSLEGGRSPQVVPSLWKARRRLCAPCRSIAH